MRIKRSDVVGIASIVAVGGLAAFLYAEIPELTPTHWGTDGVADDFSSRARVVTVALSVPALCWLLLKVAPLMVLFSTVGAAAVVSVAYSFVLYWKLHGFR